METVIIVALIVVALVTTVLLVWVKNSPHNANLMTPLQAETHARLLALRAEVEFHHNITTIESERLAWAKRLGFVRIQLINRKEVSRG